MASAEIKEIGGHKISIAKLCAVDGIKLQLGVARLAGAELATLAGVVSKAMAKAPTTDGGKIDAAALMAAISSPGTMDELGEMLERVASKATDEEMLRLMRLVFSRVVCDGRPISDIDLTFGDDSLTPWKVFIEGLKVNLGGFLAASLTTGSPPAPVTTSP